MNVEQKVTAIIKAFERPECLDLLINSIKKYYPKLKIIVADDSQNPQPRNDVEFHVLPFNIGMSKGRNFLIQQVKTPYVLVLDDDYCFIKETKIEKLLHVLENSDVDIVGGRWIWKNRVHSYHGKLNYKDGVLTHTKDSYGEEAGCKLYDIIHNFFLARTDVLIKHPWDDRLKVFHHIDFFFSHKGKMKVALHPEVFIYHKQVQKKHYQKYRFQTQDSYLLYEKKHGIKEFKSAGSKSHFEKINYKKYFSQETISAYLT
ncbi:glycosyltransferase family 2 protein [Alkalihalobacterium alkalinitrilicum]|uniref:glycosyltransferase family 2 protein n=1 Tax=Alkalihalobacterium alkalinitrilicum TaxID=427920 RepID=UPI0009952D18|nr:glycosyltransferase [Alkalihalobacterium alkalinitrilicum]